MFLEKIAGLLRGNVRFSCQSPFPERILNLCAARGIPFWDLVWLSSEQLCFTVSGRDARRLRQAAENLDCQLRAQRHWGLPFLAGRLRRRQVLLAAAGLCALGLFFASFFIWEFRVQGNETVTEEEILRRLSDEGVRVGSYGMGINSTQLRNRILLQIPELSYLAVNVRGSVAYVQVRERIPAPEVVDKREPTNTVAAKSGLVTKIQTLEGEEQVLPGTTVLEGQLLISGVVDSDRSGLRLLRGMGKVYARTWYDLTVRIPLQRQEKVYTGKTRQYFSLDLGRQRINLYRNSSITPAHCDKIVRYQKLSVLGITLPLLLRQESCRGYTLQTVSISEEQARQEGEEQLLRQLEEALTEEGSITATRFASARQGEELLVTLRAECLEQIGRQVPIPIEEQH